MISELDDLAFREMVFAWLRAAMLQRESFTREDLKNFPFQGQEHRLVGPQTGIWHVKGISDAAISIITSYIPDGSKRPYEDSVGDDRLLRYKWRGINPQHADNISLRRAMERHLPLVWFTGVGYVPGTKTQLLRPEFPVWIVAEEAASQQFVVAVDDGSLMIPVGASPEVVEITKRYNERMVQVRHHQPLFRSRVIHAYEMRCAVCRLPFRELLDAAHIKADSKGGLATVSNGMALCKIHHGAFDSNIIGISPDYVVHVKESVLQTFDGPTLQHSIKEMNGESLRQIPRTKIDRPDRDLLAERFNEFEQAS